MKKNSSSITDYFAGINVHRSKPFILIIFAICTLIFIIIDPIAFDLSLFENKLLYFSHLTISIISFLTVLIIHFISSNKVANAVLYGYLFLLTAIETAVSGGLDTPTDRGPSVFIATIFTISFVFFYTPLLSSLWLIPNYLLFVFLVIITHETTNQLMSSIGNGTIFFVIIFVMKLIVYNQKVKELRNQHVIIEYILSKKKTRNDQTGATARFVVSGELSAKFREFVIDRKQYLDKELTLNKVAKEIGTNPNYLSQCINQEYGKNFNALINEFRVDEAIKIMNHKLSRIITMEAIADESGFRSKSSFYIAFKNKTGKTPAEYYKDRPGKTCIDS